jgi:hypothetical protein
MMKDLEIVLLLLLLIKYYNSIRSRHYLTRSAISFPKYSPWRKLLVFGDDISFLEMTGLSRPCFHALEPILFPENIAQTVGNKRGRPSLLDPIDEIGLYLFFVSSTMIIMVITMIRIVIMCFCLFQQGN